MLGAVSFATKVRKFITKDGNVKNVLVMYNSHFSHSMMSTERAEELGLVLEPLGTVTTHTFMGN